MIAAETAQRSLLERAEQLRERIEALRGLRKVANEALRIRTRAEELERPTEQLESWVLVLKAFRKHGISVSLDTAVAGSVRQFARRIAGDFADDPASILDPDSTLRRAFWTPLNNLPDVLASRIRTAWVEYIDETIPQRQDDVLDVLGALPGFAEQVAQIRALYRVADDLKRTFGSAGDLQATLKQPELLSIQITEAVARLEGPGIPSEVLSFVKAASTPSGAPLDQYTESVHEWLERNGLSKLVRVRLGGLSE